MSLKASVCAVASSDRLLSREVAYIDALRTYVDPAAAKPQDRLDAFANAMKEKVTQLKRAS